MTMMDEQLIRDALADLATDIDVPEGSLDRILAAIREPVGGMAGEQESAGADGGDLERARETVTASQAEHYSGWREPEEMHSEEFGQEEPEFEESLNGPVRSGRHRRRSIALAGGIAAALLAVLALRLAAVPTFLAKRESTQAGSVARAASAPSNGAAHFYGANSASGRSTPSQSSALPSTVGKPARIEQTGSLDLVVGKGKLDATISRLTALATGNGGFVSSSQASTGSGETPSGNVTLQVPVGSFDMVLKQVSSLGKVNSVTTNATDVTAQYVNLQEQISALQASKQQYLTIMTRATSVSDILAVQSQLNNVDSQIQQLQGQLQVMTSETTYSTLSVSVTEVETSSAPRPAGGIVKALHEAVGGFVGGVEGLLSASGSIIFGLLVVLAIVALGRFTWRGIRRRQI
ncbi:MAG: DUF4349 domain-containing protein [Actinobacteria bacterium]|nr:DUF4349 domain-containing protein [Actinomycetota bacterium]MCL5447503.1 DUF4349 domain-containing protein [Actinomycetota bacterium]